MCTTLNLLYIKRTTMQCDSCNEPTPKFKCSSCKLSSYCNKDCAKRHWVSGHKQECKTWVEHFEKIRIEDEKIDAILIKLKSLEAEDVCSVCLEAFSVANVFALPCDHFICGVCVFKLPGRIYSDDDVTVAEEPPTCPLCRAPMPLIAHMLQYLYESAAGLLQRANRSPLSEDKYLLCTFARSQCKSIELFLNEIQGDSVISENNYQSFHLMFSLLDVGTLLCEGKADECIAVARQLLDANSPPLTLDMKIDLLIDIGKGYILLSQFVDAKLSFFSALQMCEHHMAKPVREIYHRLSRVFYELKDYEKAIETGKTAVAMNRNYDGVYEYLALAYKESGDLDKAVEIMKQAVAYEAPWDADNKLAVKLVLQKLLDEKESRLASL